MIHTVKSLVKATNLQRRGHCSQLAVTVYSKAIATRQGTSAFMSSLPSTQLGVVAQAWMCMEWELWALNSWGYVSGTDAVQAAHAFVHVQPTDPHIRNHRAPPTRVSTKCFGSYTPRRFKKTAPPSSVLVCAAKSTFFSLNLLRSS